MHYDGLMIYQVNSLYELIYGYTKHRDWSSFNENLSIKWAYGIVPVSSNHVLTLRKLSEADEKLISERSMLQYLAQR